MVLLLNVYFPDQRPGGPLRVLNTLLNFFKTIKKKILNTKTTFRCCNKKNRSILAFAKLGYL